MRFTLSLLCCCLAACSADFHRAADATSHADSLRSDSIARATQDSINRARPGYVIDSVHPPDEDLRRFRAAVGGVAVTTFSGGSGSRDSLVRRFMTAIAARDTAALRTMAMSGEEFAYLYYPVSPNSRPPLYQSPAEEWSLIQIPSRSGVDDLLSKFGGHEIRYGGHACDPGVLHEGSIRRYTGCLVKLIGDTGDTTNRYMFGSIVEYRGQFKFLSYSNRL
jgi:hypothetical protein